MKETRVLMGMPVTVEVVDPSAERGTIRGVFSYFRYIDEKFSTYKNSSEITKINNGELEESDWSEDMKTMLALCEKTKAETDGYFDIVGADGKYDPSGLVKGWAIHKAAELLRGGGCKNFYVDAGGDIQVRGRNGRGKKWSVGIKNPFEQKEIIKVLRLEDGGVATSGTYVRGQHIYNPKRKEEPITEIISLTVVGPNVYDADRFATAAFAMGRNGIKFLEKLRGLEGYMIDEDGVATMTSGFEKYTHA